MTASTDPRNHAVLIYLHTLTSGLCIRFGHLAPGSPLRKALSVEEAGGGAAGGVGELVGGGQEGGVAAGDAVGELVGVVLDPHGVGAGCQGAQESGSGAQQRGDLGDGALDAAGQDSVETLAQVGRGGAGRASLRADSRRAFVVSSASVRSTTVA